MRKTFQIAAAAAIFPIVALAGQAKAAIVCPSPACLVVGNSADLIWNNNGTVSLESAPSVDYTAVLQQDKLWSDFMSDSSLPAGSDMALSLEVVNGHDEHTVSFGAAFGSIGGSITWGYDISVYSGPFVLKSMTAAILQGSGSSTLDKTLVDNNSNTYTVDFTQNGNTVSGTTSVTFLPGTTTLDVTDTFTISGAYGSDATAVSNSFTQGTVPEPATWVMMLLGFAGLGFAGYRRARGDRATLAA